MQHNPTPNQQQLLQPLRPLLPSLSPAHNARMWLRMMGALCLPSCACCVLLQHGGAEGGRGRNIAAGDYPYAPAAVHENDKAEGVHEVEANAYVSAAP